MNEKQAHKLARKVLKRLGPRWKSKVWENHGEWHCCFYLLNGLFSIYEDNGLLSCLTAHDYTFCGDQSVTDDYQHKVPEMVIRHTLRRIKRLISAWQKIEKEVKAALADLGAEKKTKQEIRDALAAEKKIQRDRL